MTAGSLPLADAGSLVRELRRTRILRLALAALLAALAIAAVLFARGPRVSAGPYVPPGSHTIVVLDVSQSVELNKLRLAYSTLSFLGHSKARVGLIVVSSYAYEALPPGSPASALLPIANLFHARRVGPINYGRSPFLLPPNPWRLSFSSGTELASGLTLAREVIEDSKLRHPTVVLISDLLDDSQDLGRVTAEGQAYRKAGIPLRLVPLDPKTGDLRYFLEAAGPQGVLVQPKAPKQTARELKTGFPTSLVVVAGVLAFLLAVDDLLLAPLRWGKAKLA